MVNIEVLAVDIDGTLTDENRRICISSIEALRKVEEAGIPVILATGNISDFTYAASTLIGTTGGMVCENGGVIFKEGFNHNKVIVLSDKEKVDNAFEFLLKKFEGQLDFKITEDKHGRFSEVCFYKIFDPTIIKDAVKDLDVKVYDSGFAIHLTDSNVSKGLALEKLSELLGYNTENMMVIGDSENDLGFLDVAGFKVAVANAVDELKEIADYVCEKKHGDGVAEAIDKFIFNEE